MLRLSPVGASSSLATQEGAHNRACAAQCEGRSRNVRCYTPPATPTTGGPCRRIRRAHSPPVVDSSVRSHRHQTDLPTQEKVPAQDARIPHPYVHARWTPGSQGASSQGAQAPHPRASTVIARHRLRGRRRFAAVRTEGLRASSNGVRVQVATNGSDVARVGFALVGVRSAVRRNLLRRRLRAAVAPLLVELAGHDLVLVAGREALELPFAALRAGVADATGRALDRLRRAPAASTADNGAMTPSNGQRR
jgi:ribonuclease P protein component